MINSCSFPVIPVAPQAEKKIFTSIAVKVPLWQPQAFKPHSRPPFSCKNQHNVVNRQDFDVNIQAFFAINA